PRGPGADAAGGRGADPRPPLVKPVTGGGGVGRGHPLAARPADPGGPCGRYPSAAVGGDPAAVLQTRRRGVTPAGPPTEPPCRGNFRGGSGRSIGWRARPGAPL